MSGDEKKDNSIEEQVARISGNFESDILRLIKTQSMIKSSSGIIGEEIQYLDSKIKQIQDKLDDLNLRTSELNDFLQVSLQDKGLSSNHVGLYLNDFISSLTKENNEINTIKQDLADRLKNGSESLNSLHKFYVAELEAFQQEVDSGLTSIREEINGKINEEINTQLVEDTHEEVEEVIEETEEEPLEQTDNKEGYYAADSTAQTEEQESDDKFLYIAMGFLLLCAIGFFGYYLKYIKLNTNGENAVVIEPYIQNDQNEIKTELNRGEEKPKSNSPSKNVKPASPDVYFLSEKGTLNPAVTSADFNHKIVVKRANVRIGPGKSYGIVSVLKNGTSVAMLDENQGIWTKIMMLDGSEGWVAKKLITK